MITPHNRRERERNRNPVPQRTHTKVKKLVNEKNFIVLNCPLWDFRKLMSLLCELVRKEQSQGNFVYINLSSGSKLSAIAGTLASLMYGAVPYYVQAEQYNIEHPDIEGGKITGIRKNTFSGLKIKGLYK